MIVSSKRLAWLLCVCMFAMYFSRTPKNKYNPQNRSYYVHDVSSKYSNQLAVSAFNRFVPAQNNIVSPVDASRFDRHSEVESMHQLNSNGETYAQPWLLGERFVSHAASNYGVFSDKYNWDRMGGFSTLKTVTIGDEYFCFGFAKCGFLLKKYSKGKFSNFINCTNVFTTKHIWRYPEHYLTIKATAVAGSLYIIARDVCGMVIYKIVGNDVQVVSKCEIKFSDSKGWNKPEYYSTIQTVAAGGNLFVIGRGEHGIEMYNTWEGKIYETNSRLIPYSDENGWNRKEYYSTITSVELYGYVYVIGRSYCGIVVYRTDEYKKVKLVNHCDIPWSDANGWAFERYYSTIRAVADDRSVWIMGRGENGMEVWRLVGDTVTMVKNDGFGWSVSNDWDDPMYYSTIGTAVVHNFLYIFIRGSCGMHIYTMAEDGTTQLIKQCEPAWSNKNGWSRESQYLTIQGTAGNGLVLSGRASCGWLVYEVKPDSLVPIVKCS